MASEMGGQESEDSIAGQRARFELQVMDEANAVCGEFFLAGLLKVPVAEVRVEIGDAQQRQKLGQNLLGKRSALVQDFLDLFIVDARGEKRTQWIKALLPGRPLGLGLFAIGLF